MKLNERQRRFFEQLADMQEFAVQSCLAQHKCTDKQTESMLYEATYDMAFSIMELLDGYSGFSHHRHDVIDTVTGERLNREPEVELHDTSADFLRQE